MGASCSMECSVGEQTEGMHDRNMCEEQRERMALKHHQSPNFMEYPNSDSMDACHLIKNNFYF